MRPQVQLHLIAGAMDVPKQHMDVHLAFSVPSVEQFRLELDQRAIPYVNAPAEEKKITVRPDGVRIVRAEAAGRSL